MATTFALGTMEAAQVFNPGADRRIIEPMSAEVSSRQVRIKVQILRRWRRFCAVSMIASCYLQQLRRLRNISLVLCAMMVSISWMSSPAPAQAPDSHSQLPNAPSPPTTSDNSSHDPNDHSLTFGERARLYRRSVISFESIIGPAYGAGIGQWEDEPPGWGQGGEGYGKRFASGLGRHLVSETIKFGVAAADREDPRYFRSEDRGTWARMKHAVVSTVVSKTSSGRTIPAYSRFAGTYGAAFIANTWYPENRTTAQRALRRGSTALASSMGFNLLREFTPFFWRGKR
jgi:hypothetical protein